MLTLADVLELPVLRRADAVVLAGAEYLSATVRGTLVAGISHSLRAARQGDLVLAASLELLDTNAEISAFIHGLFSAGAAGLILESHPESVPFPDAVVAECNSAHLPVILVNYPVSFAAVVQAVTDRLLDTHSTELVSARRIHAVFTELSYAEADLEEVLLAARRLSGTAIAIENSDHQLLDYLCGTEDDLQFTDNWEARSRSITTPDRPTWDQVNGWLVAPIGSPHKDLGRLVFASSKEPGAALTAIAERSATALAALMRCKNAYDSHVRRQHHDVLTALLTNPTSPDVCRRTWLAGMPTQDRKYVGVVLRPLGTVVYGTSVPDSMRALVTACQRAAAAAHLDCIVAAFDTDVRVLLGMPHTVDEVSAVDHLAEQLHEVHTVVVAAGSPTNTFHTIDRTLRESLHVMGAISPSGTPQEVYRLTNLHVRGLLTLLAMDSRVIDFTERELAPLIAASETLHFDVLATVRTLIENWECKSQAAAKLYISRPVLYERIRRIETIIDGSLEDVEVRTSLHLALLSSAMTPYGIASQEGKTELRYG